MDSLTSDDMKTQAQHIWSMLDDMANNDPGAYRKFIDKQLKEGKEAMSPPEPHMCVLTTVYKPKTSLYINFCEWSRIPEPKSDESPIPVVGGRLETFKDDKNNTYKTVAVCFNPSILDSLGRDAKNPEERKSLVNLAIDYIQDQHNIEISRSYSLLPNHTPLKGSVDTMRKSLEKITSQQDKDFESNLDELEKTFGPTACGMKDTLLQELQNISGKGGQTKESMQAQSPIGVTSTDRGDNKGLIEELEDCSVKTPDYDITTNNSTITVVIKLPGVNSVSDCLLDISEDDVVLEVEGRYELNLQLPQKIDDSRSAAKFNKTLSQLTIVMPII